jgi:hypothetical protein
MRLWQCRHMFRQRERALADHIRFVVHDTGPYCPHAAQNKSRLCGRAFTNKSRRRLPIKQKIEHSTYGPQAALRRRKKEGK